MSSSPCRRSHPAGASRRVSRVRRAVLPSPLNREARPPGLWYFGATCAFTSVTARGLTHHPSDGLVGGLQSLGFPPPCHPSYGALALTPAGLAPAGHVSGFGTDEAAESTAAWSLRCALARTSRIEGPWSSMTWAVWMSRSQIASASVGSPITSCHALTGS